MIFTRSLLSLLVLAVIATGIPLREHHDINQGERTERQTKDYEILHSRTLNDGTRHETIMEYGDQLPSLPVPNDYEMSSVEENDGSILVPVDEKGKIDAGYLKRIQPKIVFMTKEDIERLNGSLPQLPSTSIPNGSSLPSLPKQADDTDDYEDVDVPNLPKTVDYTSSKETDPDLEESPVSNVDATKTSSDVIDKLKKELLEEIEEDRELKEEERVVLKEKKLDDELREKLNEMTGTDDDDDDDDEEVDELVVEAEEKTLIKKVIEEIDNEIIHKEVERKVDEAHKHENGGEAQPKLEVDEVDAEEKEREGSVEEEDSIFELPQSTEADEQRLKFSASNKAGFFQIADDSRPLKPSIAKLPPLPKVVKNLDIDESREKFSASKKAGFFQKADDSRPLKPKSSSTCFSLITFSFVFIFFVGSFE